MPNLQEKTMSDKPDQRSDAARYDFKVIEKKWQDYWEKNETFKTTEDPSFPKEKRYYVLDMFPYPSGADCMSAIRKDIRQRTSSRVTNA